MTGLLPIGLLIRPLAGRLNGKNGVRRSEELPK
jgi:hypothetical protein